MGIVNVTPDSFSDGGRYFDPEQALAHALDMVEQGADLLDIGAESSKPGADPIDEAEEIRRLLPVVRAVCQRTRIPVSVDTTKAAVAERALDAGAAIINDISALRFDARMAEVIAGRAAAVVLMHMKGTPKTMQASAQYDDVVREVKEFLDAQMAWAGRAGIPRDRILLDPGFGFGKNLEHNLTLLARLDTLQALKRPLVVGVSRKAFIGRVLDRPVEHRMFGTAAAVAVAVSKGARIVRVHDVTEMRDVVTMVDAIVHHEMRGAASAGVAAGVEPELQKGC